MYLARILLFERIIYRYYFWFAHREFDDMSTTGGIIHNLPDRKKRDDRTMDQFEESWFAGDDDEITDEMAASYDEAPSKQNTSVEEANDESSNSTKPLSAKLKDVDLLDNVQINRRMDSPPLSNGPSSPNTINRLAAMGIPRPISPVNSASSPPHAPKEQQEQQQESVFTKTLNNKSVITNRTFVNNKFTNNKPKMQIKINSTNLTDSKRTDEVDEHPKNGVTTDNDTGNDPTKYNATLNHANNSVKIKPVCICCLFE